MDKNEIFKTVAEHLLSMQKRSSNKHGDCLYRGPNGLKCAIGVLIPDSLYKKVDIEGEDVFGVVDLWKNYKVDFPKWIEENLNLLNQLQNIHDNYFHDRWTYLAELSREFKISPEYIPDSLKGVS